MSLEHFISKSVSAAIANDKDGLTVSGLPFLIGKSIQLQPKAIAVGRVLCDKHNSDLHYLDDAAKQFVESLAQARSHFRANHDKQTATKTYSINGNHIELWFLKAICGMVASGNVTCNGQPVTGNAPLPILNLLYQVASFQAPWGLYLTNKIGDRPLTGPEDDLTLAPVFGHNNSTMIGCIGSFYGFQYVLVLANINRSDPGLLLEGAIYRPTNFDFVDSITGNKVQIALSWDRQGDGKGIEIVRNLQTV